MYAMCKVSTITLATGAGIRTKTREGKGEVAGVRKRYRFWCVQGGWIRNGLDDGELPQQLNKNRTHKNVSMHHPSP